MSTTRTSAAAPAGPLPAPVRSPLPPPMSGTHGDSRGGLLGRATRSTPGRMRLVAIVLVLMGLLVGLGAAQSFSAADGALQRADENAEQLVRLQDIQTRLVRADADATNAFLVGGLEPVDQRRDYDEAIERATELVAFAARAQPADGVVLAALNTSIQRYTSEIERARAANRQALPLGAQYLRNASAGLRADALPQLAALTQANEERAAAEFGAARSAGVVVVAACLLGLVVVGIALVWLARRTHRYVNVPVLAAGAVVLLLLIAAAGVLGGVGATVGRVEEGSYAATRALAAARIAAFDAKANESLTLVSRGSGAAFEEAWLASSATADERIADAVGTGLVPDDLIAAWTGYGDLHRAIRELDDGGAWEQAVAAATSRETGAANAAYGAFDTSSGAALDVVSDSASSSLQEARSGLTLGLWLGLAAGLATAALAWRGVSQRIEEYR